MNRQKAIAAVVAMAHYLYIVLNYSSTAACAAAKILCKWEMREVIGNICKTFPYIFIVYYFSYYL